MFVKKKFYTDDSLYVNFHVFHVWVIFMGR